MITAPQKNAWVSILTLVAFLSLGGLAWFVLDLAALLRWAQSLQGPLPALVLVPLQTLIALSFSPLPSDIAGVTLCVIYGSVSGGFLTAAAWILAAWIEYGVARRVADRFDLVSARARLPAWLQRMPIDHPGFLICGRWFPLGPHLVNTLAGTNHVPLWRFTWTAAVGILPVVLILAAIASGLIAAGGEFDPPGSA